MNPQTPPQSSKLLGGKSPFSGSSLRGYGFEENVWNIQPTAPPSGVGGLPELRSAEVNEVLSQPPSWLVSWGTTIFFGVMVLLLAVTWLVHYPDLVRGNLKIVAKNLPKSVVAKSDGKLIRLLVADNQMVTQGQRIAFLESTASHEEVLTLDSLTTHLVNLTTQNNLPKVYQTPIKAFFSLGELQKSFQTFQEMFVKVKSFVGEGTYLQKRQILTHDLATMQDLRNNLGEQLKNTQQDYALAEDEFNRQKGLLKGNVISKNDYNQLLAKLLSKKQNLEQMNSSLKNSDISQNQKRQEILELDKNITEQKNAFTQALYALKSDIEAWKQRYVSTAPTSGKAVFLQSLQENQQLKTGQELLYILPEGTGYHGEMTIGQYNFGKVKRGQEIIVKLQSYPFEEYGTIRGKIQSIAEIPKDSTYYIQVTFPNGLKTSAQKNIPFRNGMTASGEIITEDKRLIERFLKEFMRIFQR